MLRPPVSPDGGIVTPLTTGETVSERVRQIIFEHGRLPTDVNTLGDDDDLYRAGMTSHASVNLMLALEAAFDVEFPDSMLKRSVFQSVSSITQALQTLGASA